MVKVEKAMTMLFETKTVGEHPWRTGTLNLPRGPVATPVFMPVGTQATVKTLSVDEIKAIGAQLILANTYHLHLRPGEAMIARRGGLHGFMHWDGSILTDSGGFQVFSMSDIRTITEEGVEFRSHLDGSKHKLTPETVVAIQLQLGSDIMMPLDVCTGLPATRDTVAAAMQRSLRWLARARQVERPDGRFLFGIVQGGLEDDLRRESAAGTVALDCDGYSIGGLSVGEAKEDMLRTLEVTVPCLPADKPRYLMGVGTPPDLWYGVARGVDMFDCVLPTRNARNGQVFTPQGPMNIGRLEFAEDDNPIDATCDCYTCRTHSRSYVRHLLRAGEMLGKRLTSIHNLRFMVRTIERIRAAIDSGTFQAEHDTFLREYLRR